MLAVVRAPRVGGQSTEVGRRWRLALGALASVAVALPVAGCGGAAKATKAAPLSYDTLVGAGGALVRTGDLGGARQLFQRAIARNPHSPVAYYELGVVYERERKTYLAAVQYSRALQVDRAYVPALYNEAGIVARNNRPLAIYYYRAAIHLQPDLPTAYLRVGLLEWAGKRTRTQALRDLAHAVKLDPALRAAIPAAVRARLPRKTA